MKYTKPGLTLEKFSFTPLSATPGINSIPEDGPVKEPNDPTFGADAVNEAFIEVFDFSKK